MTKLLTAKDCVTILSRERRADGVIEIAARYGDTFHFLFNADKSWTCKRERNARLRTINEKCPWFIYSKALDEMKSLRSVEV